jgi:hypothetical protein
MKPMSATEALRNSTPSFFSRNRFDTLRNRTDSGSGSGNVFSQGRERVNSIKRKASVEINSDSGKRANQGTFAAVDKEKLISMDRKLNLLRGLCSKLNEDAPKLKVDIGLENVIRTFCEFVDVGSSMFQDLVNCCRGEKPETTGEGNVLPPAQTAAVPAVSADPDQDSQGSYSQVAAKKPVKKKANPNMVGAVPPRDPKLQAFHDAVKQAEKSTLVFNLDLGRHKTLNEKTILSRATLALSEAAATVEGNKGKPPSKEAISALDDLMSVTENVTLFGRVTKPYVNKFNDKDPRNKTFFTLPIRYEFRDKDTKIEAETILRDTCKVDCTTPYPTILRHCIKQVIDHMRKEYPGDFIKVTVDSLNRQLKVARRKKGEGWYTLDNAIKLPVEVLDVHARFVPEGLVMDNLPTKASLTEEEALPDESEMSES